MKHDCQMGTIKVFDDADGITYIQLITISMTSIPQRVEYCPFCGKPSKKMRSEIFKMYPRNDSDDDSDNDNFQLYNTFFSENSLLNNFCTFFREKSDKLNKKIDSIKFVMTNQTCQNEIFMNQISNLKSEILEIKKKIYKSEK